MTTATINSTHLPQPRAAALTAARTHVAQQEDAPQQQGVLDRVTIQVPPVIQRVANRLHDNRNAGYLALSFSSAIFLLTDNETSIAGATAITVGGLGTSLTALALHPSEPRAEDQATAETPCHSILLQNAPLISGSSLVGAVFGQLMTSGGFRGAALLSGVGILIAHFTAVGSILGSNAASQGISKELAPYSGRYKALALTGAYLGFAVRHPLILIAPALALAATLLLPNLTPRQAQPADEDQPAADLPPDVITEVNNETDSAQLSDVDNDIEIGSTLTTTSVENQDEHQASSVARMES